MSESNTAPRLSASSALYWLLDLPLGNERVGHWLLPHNTIVSLLGAIWLREGFPRCSASGALLGRIFLYFSHAINLEFNVLRQQDALGTGFLPVTQPIAKRQSMGLGFFKRLAPRGSEEPPVLSVQDYGWAGWGLHQTGSFRPEVFIEVSDCCQSGLRLDRTVVCIRTMSTTSG